jgi:hypothetical protein
MARIGYVVKKISAEIKDSPWAIEVLGDGERGEIAKRTMALVGQSGVKWVRLYTTWTDIEKEKGRYDWSVFDTIVDGLVAQGTNVLICSGCATHPLYEDFPAGHNYPPVRTPAALDAYCAYVAAMARRYGDRVKHYEIWNEPNIDIFWRPRVSAEEYGLLVARAGAAIHAALPGAKVVVGSLAGVGRHSVDDFAKGFLSYPGALEQSDIFSYHPYAPDPESASEYVRSLVDTVRTLRPGMPMWQDECGCPSSGDTIHFRGDAPWGYNVQSKWLLRRLLTDRLDGADMALYFLLVEFFGNLRPGSPELRTGYNTKGLIQHTTWQVKPAYYALQNLTATLDSTCRPSGEQTSIEVIDPGTFYGIGPHEDRFPCVPKQFAMRKGTTPVLAYWLPWRPQEIIRPATVHITWPDVSWMAPVYVDLLSGEVHEAKVMGSAIEVPLADYPLILTERSWLDLAATPQQPSYEEIISKLRWTFEL